MWISIRMEIGQRVLGKNTSACMRRDMSYCLTTGIDVIAESENACMRPGDKSWLHADQITVVVWSCPHERALC